MAAVLILDLTVAACTQAVAADMEQTLSETATAEWEVTMDSILTLAIKTLTIEVAATWATATTRQMCSKTETRSLRVCQPGIEATINVVVQ